MTTLMMKMMTPLGSLVIAELLMAPHDDGDGSDSDDSRSAPSRLMMFSHAGDGDDAANVDDEDGNDGDDDGMVEMFMMALFRFGDDAS